MPQHKVRLVVTGDHFEYCPKRNQGIVDCFQAGGISNVSLLVNASLAKEATELAKSRCSIVLSDCGIPYACVTVERGLQACPWLSTVLRDFYTQLEKDVLESDNMASDGLTSVPNLRRAFSHGLELDLGGLTVTSWGWNHPQEGGCGEGPDDFSQSADRQQELTTLKDPALLA
ncbi:unnamed protein product [Coregonus sp. 'balchen']|nr:unnamed protein product [Coregonus sp. 'balchen']